MILENHFDAGRYPKSYSASIGWKLFFGVFGVILGVGGLCGIWYFGTGHEVRSGTAMLVMIVVCLALAILGWLCVFAIVFSKILVLTASELVIPGVFRDKRIERAQITGYRQLVVQGLKVLQLEYLTSGSKKKSAKISMLFSPDAAFSAWFQELKNLDVEELQASIREVEQDTELGSTPAERLDNVNRARKIARVLHFAVVGSLFWAMFYPRPYALLFLILLTMPWLSILLCAKYRGSFTIEDGPRNTARADLTVLLIMPGFVLALRALYDSRLLDATQLIVPSVVWLAVLLGTVVWIAPLYRRKPWKLLVLGLLLPAYSAGSIATANWLFDSADSTTYRVNVLHKRYTTGKGASQYFTLSPWGPFQEPNEVSVSRPMYSQTPLGGLVCIHQHPGALKLDWYSLTDSDC